MSTSAVRNSMLMIRSWVDHSDRCPFHFQVGQEKGNCSFQRNPTPCIIPQEQENIFHTIFAFFTKSGRKVLVRICLLIGTIWVVLSKKASPRQEASFLFGIYYFPNLVLITWLRKSQGLWSAPVFQPEVSKC